MLLMYASSPRSTIKMVSPSSIQTVALFLKLRGVLSVHATGYKKHSVIGYLGSFDGHKRMFSRRPAACR